MGSIAFICWNEYSTEQRPVNSSSVQLQGFVRFFESEILKLQFSVLNFRL